MTYVTHYKNPVTRFLYSFFVQMPMTLWFKYLSYPLYQPTIAPQYLPIWFDACANLAGNNFTLSAYGNVPHPPDKRAKTILPYGVTVISCPDEPIANLTKVGYAWSSHKAPSGVILQLSGLSYSTVHAFTLCGRHARVYAAASEIPAVLQYEFENIILARLGYSVADR